jgi:hypothetical protein
LDEKSFELSLNDYLGLNHPEVRKADTDAAIKTVQHILWERE